MKQKFQNYFVKRRKKIPTLNNVNVNIFKNKIIQIPNLINILIILTTTMMIILNS